MTPYTPRGKIIPLLKLMREDPMREWTAKDVVAVIGGKPQGASPMLEYAVKAEVIHRSKNADGLMVFRAQPYRASEQVPAEKRLRMPKVNIVNGWATSCDDPRIPRVVPGWVPPRMACVRLES